MKITNSEFNQLCESADKKIIVVDGVSYVLSDNDPHYATRSLFVYSVSDENKADQFFAELTVDDDGTLFVEVSLSDLDKIKSIIDSISKLIED